MSIRPLIALSAAGLMLITGSASAAIETHELTLTNDTGVNWGSVLIFLQPPRFGSAPQFLAMSFVEQLSLHGASAPGATVEMVPGALNDMLRFTFSETQPILGNGQEVTFTVTVDNPFELGGWKLGWRTIDAPTPPVPAPAAASLLAAPGLLALRRRRRY